MILPLKKCFFLVLSVCALGLAAHADLYVDPVNGKDTNAGAAANQPFATLEKARDTIRNQKLNQEMKADLTVWLKGGRYELNDTLIFDERDSGSNGHKVIYQAIKDETPVVCGGKKVTGWKPVAGKPYWVAEVPRHAPVKMTSVADPSYYPPPHNPRFYSVQTYANAGFADYFAQLYVNGVRAERARSHTAIASSRNEWWRETGSSFLREGIYVKKSDCKNYTNPEDVRIVWLELFKTADVPVRALLPAGEDEVIFKMKTPDFTTVSGWARITPTTSFFIVNALEELDEPGEWYLDQKKRLVYYYPFKRDGDLNQADVIAPNVECLVRIAGSALAPVRGLRFAGITFQCGNWTGAKDEYLGLSQAEIFKSYSAEIPGQIILDHAEKIEIVGCVVRNMGSCGIQPYEYCRNILIDGNTTYDTTGAGISVGRYWFYKRYCQPESVCTDVTVSNNLVRDTGRDYWQATGINIFAAYKCRVYHNDISDTAYTALHARIGDDGAGGFMVHPTIGKIEYKYNKISRAFQGHKWGIGDGGHLYMHGRYGGNEVSENYSLHANYNVNYEYYSDNNSYGIRWTNNVSRYTQAYASRFYIGGNNSGVVYDNNYSDQPSGKTNGGGTHTNFHLVQNDQWPPEAQKIMDHAGLEPKWRYLYDTMYGHENLAERKKCWSSSVADSAKNAECAVDANWGNCWASKPDDAAAFWAVDLGAKHVLQRITIIPRQDQYDEHARQNLEVQASNDPAFKEYAVLCERGDVPWYNKPGDKHVTNMWEQYLPAMPAYRYLRVKSTTPGSLSIGEFAAYGYLEKK